MQKNKKPEISHPSSSPFERMVQHMPDGFKEEFKENDFKKRASFLFPGLLFWFLANHDGKKKVAVGQDQEPRFQFSEVFTFSKSGMVVGLRYKKGVSMDLFLESSDKEGSGSGSKFFEISSCARAKECEVFGAFDTHPRNHDNFENPNYHGKNGLPILCKIDHAKVAFLGEVLYHYQQLTKDIVFKVKNSKEDLLQKH